MSSHRGFKQWRLSKTDETISTFEDWRSNLCFTLKQDKDFAPFLKKDVKWTKTKTDPTKRGLEAKEGKSAEDRVEDLTQMLESISSFSPWVRKASIVDNTKCLEDVWQAIRLHYGFKTSGANFIDFVNIKLDPNERHEDLYQRMASFIDDHLLKKNDDISHDGDPVTTDEILSPSLENLVVLLWLEKIHPKLPALVKQKYATELRSKTLYSLKPEISMSIPSLLEELSSLEEAKVMRLGVTKSIPPYQQSQRKSSRENQRRSPECCLCKQAGRPDYTHWVSSCKFFPERDRRFFAKTRQIMGFLEKESEEEEEVEEKDRYCGSIGQVKVSPASDANVGTVMIKTCPVMNVFCNSNPAVLTLDCGAEADMIRYNIAVSLGIKIRPTPHGTTQADGRTPLGLVGEAHAKFYRDGMEFTFNGLVVMELAADILGGIPFLDRNDITHRAATQEMIFRDGSVLKYKAITKSVDAPARIQHATILRVSETQTLWPGDHIDFSLEDPAFRDCEVAIEPRFSERSYEWLEPTITSSVNGNIRVFNTSNVPQTIKKHDHVGEVSATFIPDITEDQSQTITTSAQIRSVKQHYDHTSDISVDPDEILSPSVKDEFLSLHQTYKEVFDPQFPGYNHAFGKFEAVVNMGNVKPPQRKGRLPQYSRNKLVEVQERFDDLERLGVLAKPESIGVNIEYLNPSFLVKKGESGFRLVTAFTEVGKYCKPQPTLLPTVDSTLRTIAHWNYLITTDLKSAYYQIPLSPESMKYCGTASPFKGSRVYTRCAMGMPGSESALEELLSRIVGDLITKGIVCKIADDLYCGGQSEKDLLNNWEEVLKAFATADIRLTASKTRIAPTKTLLLGWIWNQGKLEASPHKISALSKCSVPTTVKDMRSFLGAYKVLSRVIPNCSHFLQLLNKSTAGKASNQKIEWNETLKLAFEKAQKHLLSHKVIHLPRETDQLFIVTDGATETPTGIGATLYIMRDSKLKLAGFFSQQLNNNQSEKWFPCEVEGIAIAAAIKFFNGYITQSCHRTKVLTDSKPCRDAYNLLCKGEFSSNARLSTFLNTVSRYHVTIDHLAGIANAPSDFGSRNPIQCVDDKCQVCLFTNKLNSSVVRSLSVSDVKSGKAHLLYTNRKAWIDTQSECPDLRRVKAQLMQGTRPSKKETTIPNVKRYLNRVTIANDGLLVVRKSDPLSESREAIVVPALIIPGLVTALHIRFDHPSANELLSIVERSFFALNMSKIVNEVTSSCHTCSSLAKVPKHLTVQSTSEPPATFGSQFACDIIRRERQMIMVVREYISSYTLTKLIRSEQHEELRAGLITLLVDFVPLDGPLAVIRTDPAPGFKALLNDQLLKSFRLQIELGQVKNKNKNPVAERAVQELEEIIRKMESHGEPLNDQTLSIATSRLNRKLRSNGLSSREILTQRNQFTNEPIPLCDKDLILQKHANAIKDRETLENSLDSTYQQPESIQVGDLVHLYSDKDKHHPRCRYIVTSVDEPWLQIRKFSGSQLRSLPYRVKVHEVYRVPSQCHVPRLLENDKDDECMPLRMPDKDISSLPDNNQPSDTPSNEKTTCPVVDDIPSEIATPPNDNDLDQDTSSSTEIIDDDHSNDNGYTGRPKRNRKHPKYLKDYST